jgi:Flp pilus assembly protein TadD/LysM repeat protein
MPGCPSIAARHNAVSRLARIGRGCRRAASATALLTLIMMAGGCAGLPPTHDRITAEDHDGKLAQVMRMAESVKASGDASAAAVFYRRAHTLAPQKLEPLVGLAQSAAALGANEEAAQLYRRAVALAPGDARVRLGFGRVLLALDRPDLAAPELRAAVAADPQDYRAYVALGVALDLSCDQRQAQDVYRDGLRHDPGNLSLRNNLALSLALAGDDDEAIDMLRELSRELGAGPRVRQNLALVYALAGRAEDAAAMAQRDFVGARLRHNLALYDSLRGMSGPRLAADVVCGGEPAGAVFSSAGPHGSSSAPAALGEEALARQDAVPPVATVVSVTRDSRLVAGGRVDAASWVTSAGVPSTNSDHIGATKIKSAVEVGALAALQNADESEGAPGDDAAASYTVRQGDTLSKIAKKYYGNGRKYLALMDANRTTLAHPDKIYPGMVVRIPVLG